MKHHRTLKNSFQSHNRGFTMIELIVAITVIGLLLAILLPAVQQVRGSARRLECKNRLRQCGIALQQHHDVHQRFPSIADNRFSALVALLPYLEQDTLFQSLDLEEGVFGDENVRRLSAQPLSIFRCPSNPFAPSNLSGDLVVSSGIGFPAAESGLIRLQPIQIKDVTDGLSNTAAMSEVVAGMDYIHYLSKVREQNLASHQQFAAECSLVPRDTPRGRQLVGDMWFSPGIPTSHYTHAGVPGGSSCQATNLNLFESIVAARSLHSGDGVNVLFADGHCQFVSTQISLDTWTAFGSIAGQELSP